MKEPRRKKLKNKARSFIGLLILLAFSASLSAQCCTGGGGGAGSLAGNFAQGVLLKGQILANLNFQHIHTNRFLEGHKFLKSEDYHALAPNNYLSGFDTKLLYLRIGFGLTNRLTIFAETGYYINKTDYRVNYLVDKTRSSGMADLTIAPSYNVFLKTTEKYIAEITVGLGVKIPLGPYNDSVLVFTDTISGTSYYDRKSPAVQLSSGANDFRFTSSFSYRFVKAKLGLSLTGLCILKGWNPVGEKFGNYYTASLFVTKTILPNLFAIGQIKGEFIGRKKLKNGGQSLISASDLAENSGSMALFFCPRIAYNVGQNLSFFALIELPVFQHVNGIQLGTKFNYSAGVTFKILPKYKNSKVSTD